MHPTEPWLLACLYSGHVHVWNYNDGSMSKSFEVTELPGEDGFDSGVCLIWGVVRTAKFAVRKQWVIAGSDDMMIRVFNYNTMDKVKSFEAHTDYIRHFTTIQNCLRDVCRSIAVHPTLPYLLSSSDDMLIKLWDWDNVRFVLHIRCLHFPCVELEEYSSV